MQRLTKAIFGMFLLLGFVFLAGCDKKSDVKVNTYDPQDITENRAVCGADVVVAEGLSLTEIGVCWSTESNPTYSDSHISTDVWNEPFVCAIEDLEPNTKYHVRGYALRGLDLYYGDDKSFVTLESNGGGDNPGNGDDPVEDKYIDLGLPSGILWATCNIGANRPEVSGDFYAWGEIAAKTTYDWSTYQYWDGTQVTKYTGSDELYELQGSDDVAESVLGEGWRIPTKADWEELLSNCEHAWTTRNGVNGSLFTGPNGKSIFLPAAGYYNNNAVYDEGHNGRYWSSSLYTDNNLNAWRLIFYSDTPSLSTYNRCFGQSVRAVRDF